MSTITFNVPNNIDLTELTKALGSVGIFPDELSPNEADEQLIPLDVAIADALPDMTWQEIIGAKLKTVRQEAKLTQKELAELVGDVGSNISAMEHGKRSISKSMAQKLGNALNVTYHTFL